MTGLCECGCGGRTRLSPQNHTAKGYVKGEPRRFLAGHNDKRTFKSLRWIAEDRGFDTPCHIWQLSLFPNGYGQETVGLRRPRGAHVIAYERANGPAPDGLHVDHRCGVRACVNPDHLEAVTPGENQRRGALRRRLRERVLEEIAADAGFDECDIAKRVNEMEDAHVA